MRLGRLPAVAGLLAALLAAPAAGQEPDPLTLTDPGHLPAPEPRPLLRTPEPGGVIERPRDRYIRYRSPAMAYVFDDPIAEVAVLDQAATRACRRGRFNEAVPHMWRARTDDRRPIGVAFGTGANLRDPDGLAVPGLVYFFDQADTGRCTVHVLAADEAAAFANR